METGEGGRGESDISLRAPHCTLCMPRFFLKVILSSCNVKTTIHEIQRMKLLILKRYLIKFNPIFYSIHIYDRITRNIPVSISKMCRLTFIISRGIPPSTSIPPLNRNPQGESSPSLYMSIGIMAALL